MYLIKKQNIDKHQHLNILVKELAKKFRYQQTSLPACLHMKYLPLSIKRGLLNDKN